MKAEKHKKNILVYFGGDSFEHAVSVITGLQVIESINREKYTVFPIYQTENGEILCLHKLNNRKDFLRAKKILVSFGTKHNHPVIKLKFVTTKTVKIDAAIVCCHGGKGESGGVAGLFELINLPYSSPSIESSAIAMNKSLSKSVIHTYTDIDLIEGMVFVSEDIQQDSLSITEKILSHLGQQVIIKPVHLGSSIGISVAKDPIEIEKSLIDASYIDDEILVERFLDNIQEYNISVFEVQNNLLTSEIESPKKQDNILSYEDKYSRGSKKLQFEGMASSNRDLPAKIDDNLRQEIISKAKVIYKTLKCKGIIRIDFIFHNGVLYFNEINPVPGSLSYYLWEPLGIQFCELIDMMIDDAISRHKQTSKTKTNQIDILKNFLS